MEFEECAKMTSFCSASHTYLETFGTLQLLDSIISNFKSTRGSGLYYSKQLVMNDTPSMLLISTSFCQLIFITPGSFYEVDNTYLTWTKCGSGDQPDFNPGTHTNQTTPQRAGHNLTQWLAHKPSMY